jgi:hypothetical protein
VHYSSIQSGIVSGNVVLQMLQGLASMDLESKTVAHINVVQERVSDMIAVLISVQQELIKLLIENRELCDQIKVNGRGRTFE